MITPIHTKTLELSLAWVRQRADAGVADSVVLRHVLERVEALEAAQQQPADHIRDATEMDPTPEGAPPATMTPHGYAYRYPGPLGGIEFTDGQAINGSRPIEAIPYWLGVPPTPEAAPVADDSDLQTFHGIALDMVDTLPILPEIKRTLRRAIREPMQQPTLEAAPVVTDQELLSMRSWSSHGPTLDSDLVDFGRRCYNLNREPSATHPPAAQPTSPPAPAGGLVQVVAEEMGPQSQAALDAGELPYGTARAAIHEVARWLDFEGYNHAANDLREEASQ